MSIPVELHGLDEALACYRFAYLLTSSEGAAPHAVAVTPVLDAGDLLVSGLGRRSRRNLLAQPEASLVWPPEAEGGYSLSSTAWPRSKANRCESARIGRSCTDRRRVLVPWRRAPARPIASNSACRKRPPDRNGLRPPRSAAGRRR